MSRPDDKSLITAADTQRSVDPDVVEFALVLSRTIDSLQQQPDQMRQALYELARHKLGEQLKGRDGKDFRVARATLETAIDKVEQFYSVHGDAQEALRKLSPPRDSAEHGGAANRVALGAPPATPVQAGRPKWALGKPAAVALRLAAVLLLIVAGAVVLQAFRWFDARSGPQKAAARIEAPAASTAPQQQPPAVEQAARKPERLLPSHFGAFAVADDRLVELRALRGTMPDPRIAISAAIRDHAGPVLPDGRFKFIVYRRDPSGAPPARAEVRVIARVKQYQAGSEKRDANAEGDHWVIRNISFPYRVAPVPGSSDMYEVESEAADFTLSPGRYALIWKGAGYDFVVAGDAGRKHCLERIAAVNGVFYSECR